MATSYPLYPVFLASKPNSMAYIGSHDGIGPKLKEKVSADQNSISGY